MKFILPALVCSCLFTSTPELPNLAPPPTGSALATVEPAGVAGKRVSKMRPHRAQRPRPKASESMMLYTVR